MSENENLDGNASNSTNGVSATSMTNFNKGAGWAKAIAIIGFIGGGLMALGGIFALFGIPVLGIIYLVIAGVYIYLNTLLMKQANAASSGSFNLEELSLNFMKYWKFTVILMIIGVVLGIISSVTMGAMFSSASSSFNF